MVRKKRGRKEPNYKKLCWDIFSKFIRLRDCIETTGTNHSGMCFTCGRIYPLKKLQAGHFVPGRRNAYLLDEYGVHAQCKQCNFYRGGEQLLYRRHLVEKYGEDLVQSLEMKRHMKLQRKKVDWMILYGVYRDKYETLKREYGGS